ncbi:HD-GYP domain-containing protein [Marinicrinis sediminis]|uniref:HD-GYP domain-containing protein n=1 Tax=Marinicrinis sediminis TaxID=1652465 RepID=A0ABW5RBA0_9BACL
MTERSIHRLKPGQQLSEDVLTGMGHVLFKKERVLIEQDLEILHAFLIKSVSVKTEEPDEKAEQGDPVQKESKENEKAADEKKTENKQKPLSPFEEEYQKMVVLLQKTLKQIIAGEINLLDIRQQLSALIQHIHEYNVLTYSPQKAKVEDYLIHNSIVVSLTSYQLAKWMNYDQKDLLPIALGGLLHDIGNVKVDLDILTKPGKLTSSELEEVRKHTVIGYNMLKPVPGLNEGVKLTALQHHEREDGSGYPLGLKSDRIHPYSKIVAVADIFHAMSSNRHYKKAASPYRVLEQIFNDSFGKLDPTIVQTFIHKVTQFHNGTLVKLNNGLIGEIVFSDRSHPTRPWVKADGKVINLVQETHLFIDEVMKMQD